ncbi:24623_t:CDS:2 [Cetraspora pellucida]|uniref:24623_t:CDS:1 n=1 Tax=Cetraspora pellucida TaxID=1433469 RepID=A0A9N9JZE8_9GLOM|nr:24623_t:CDS:2 [Cetraspora pellucida]
MTDAQETKLKYRCGTCFSYYKCLYCGIDLQQQRCNCNLTDVPHKDNQTEAVKYAFTRVFKPNCIKEQVEYICQKIEAKKHKAISTPAALAAPTVMNIASFSEIELYDLTTPEDEPNEFEEREWEFTDNRNNEHNDNESLFDEDSKYEYNYRIVTTIDELLLELHINIETLTKRRSIESSYYCITFKPEKATGDLELDKNSDNDTVTNFKNKNSIPKALNLSPNELLIAKNVLEIRKKNHCLIHYQSYSNKDSDKENYIKITFMIFSIWAFEIVREIFIIN